MKKVLIITEEGKTLQDGLASPTPYELIFKGSFLETHQFVEKLRTKFSIPVDFFVVSNEHGLMNGNELVKPEKTIQAQKSKKIRKRIKLQIYEKIIELLEKYDITIILLSTDYLKTIFSPEKDINFLHAVKKDGKVLVVCAKSVGQELSKETERISRDVEIFVRVGVARIGIENQMKILKIIRTGRWRNKRLSNRMEI